MVVLRAKIVNNEPLEPFSIGLRSDHECRRTSSSRIHGIRRRDRRRRAVRPCRGDPAEAAQCRSQHCRGGEGFRGRRAHPVGAVIDPVSLDKLIPDWREDADCPLKTQVKDDRFYWTTATSAIRLPNFAMPPLMNNHHCYIGSLGDVCRWLGPKAEALGVEIYPGFAAAEVLYDDNGAVRGIATGDMGIARDGSLKDSFTRGMELLGKYTLFAEGARGSLSKQLIAKFSLDANSEPAKFGIGLKEVWEIDPAKHQKGLIQHSFGWPLNNSTGGGSFLSHYDDNKVAVGFVVHLNYDDPYLSPFDE